MNKKIVIIGASGHGKVVANIAKLNEYEEILFIDDDTSKINCGDYLVIGTSNKIDELIAQDYGFIVSIGNNEIRKKIYELLLIKNARLVTLIHPSAVIDESVSIGDGTVIMANVVINSNTVIGNACIVNTASSVDHDCIIKDYVHISPGVNIAGTVTIGYCTWIGIGTEISNNIEITDNSIIGAGSVVIKDILNEGTYVGAPVRKVK